MAGEKAAEKTAEKSAGESVRERALSHGRQGLALYNEGRFVEAREHFSRADALVHSPVFLLYMARCQVYAHRLLAGRNLYETMLAERLAAGAPDRWQDAHRDAREELAVLRSQIPMLLVEVHGGEVDGSATVLLNGRKMATPQTQPWALDPGRYELQIRGGGHTETRHLQLREGEGLVRVNVLLPAPLPRSNVFASHAAVRGERNVPLVVGGAVATGVGFIAGMVGVTMALGQGVSQRSDPDAEGAAAVFGIVGGVPIAAGVPMLIIGIRRKVVTAKPEVSLFMRPAGGGLQIRY